MWEKRYEKTFVGLDKRDVWSVWSDVATWPQWDADTEATSIDGPFEAGTVFRLRPKGGPNVRIRIIEADPARGFTDVTNFPLAKMYDIHEIEEVPEGLRLANIIRVVGPLTPLWSRLVAQGVASGVPKQLDALVVEAMRRRTDAHASTKNEFRSS